MRPRIVAADIDWPEIAWSDVYKTWRRAAGYELASLLIEPVRFTDVPIAKPWTLEGSDAAFLWMRGDRVEHALRTLRAVGYAELRRAYSLNKGTVHTLEMLWLARADAEGTAAIWIAAFLYDLFKELLPRPWRGRTAGLLRSVQSAALAECEKRELWPWHHATRSVLPYYIAKDEFAERTRLRDLRDVLEVIQMAAVLCQTAWVPMRAVVVEHLDDELSRSRRARLNLD